ncbi:MAG: DMT family transporter [Bacteroidales bacterium]|nr:DMT family transporter [Bacteroidales bacterium]
MKKDYFLLHLSVFIAGFTGVLGRLITLDSAILVWWRMAAAAVIMFLYLRVGGLLKTNTRGGTDARGASLQRYKFGDVLQMGGVGMLLCLHWVFFYASIKASNVSIGVVCFSLVGFFTALFEPIVNKHQFSGREFLFSLLTILGIYLIFHFDSRYRLGIALGVVSSALYALFAIANQRVGKHYEAKNMLLWEMVGGLIGLTCLIPLYNAFIPVGRIYPVGMDYAYLAFMVVICTIGLCLLQIIVLQKIPAFTVNLTYNLEPVYSIILSMFIFSEYKELNFSFCIGIALIIISVVLQTWSEVRRKQNYQNPQNH